MPRFHIWTPLALLFLGIAAGCDLPQAHGDAHAIIVGAPEGLIAELEEPMIDILEPTVQTITSERAFRTTWSDPGDLGTWGDLRRFRQLVVIGTAEDPWIATALEEVEGDPPLAPPQLLEAENVWSRGQIVHIVLLGEGHGASEVLALGDELHERIDARFRDYALARMFTSGRNTELADSLEAEAGFRLVLPDVYQHSSQDDVYRFRNDNPTPSERIREIALTWETPIPDSLPTMAELMEWRNGFAEVNYHDPQLVDTTAVELRPIEVAGNEALEFQSAWTSPEGAWPAGGPFITRVIPCPGQDRLYRIDAWLYAPGQDKYEYMLQLRTILDSFQCGTG